MTDRDLNSLKKRFSDYTGSFISREKDNRNARFKIEHSHQVCSNSAYIARASSLPIEKRLLAETMGLFHDIGRFPQYEKYRTFEDSKSINHGLLGAETLRTENILQNLSDEERNLIITVVQFHNVFDVPRFEDENTAFFLRLIRDADKIDILRVFGDYYESPEEERASATAFGLPDTPEYSEEIVERIYQKKKVSYSYLRTVNDFKLINLSWSYSLNFKESYRLLQEKGHLKRIIAQLPEAEEVQRAAASVERFVEEKLKEDT